MAHPFGPHPADSSDIPWLTAPFRGRRTARPRSQAPGKRKLLFEALEPRLLLSADIAPGAQAAIQSGLDELQNWTERLGDLDALSARLPVIERSISDALDLPDLIQTQLLDPIDSFFSAPPGGTPDTDELVAVLQGLAETVGDVTGDLVGDEIVFDLNFSSTRSTGDLTIDLGDAADDLGLSVDASATVDLSATVAFDFSFGVNVNTNDFFLRVEDLTLTAEVDAVPVVTGRMLNDLDDSVLGANVDLRVILNSEVEGPPSLIAGQDVGATGVIGAETLRLIVDGDTSDAGKVEVDLTGLDTSDLDALVTSLDALLQTALDDAGKSGEVATTLGNFDRITFAADAGAGAQALKVVGGESLGFGTDQTSLTEFRLDVTVAADDTTDNTSIADLASDVATALDTALAAAGLEGMATVSESSGAIAIAGGNGTITSLKVIDAADIGIGESAFGATAAELLARQAAIDADPDGDLNLDLGPLDFSVAFGVIDLGVHSGAASLDAGVTIDFGGTDVLVSDLLDAIEDVVTITPFGSAYATLPVEASISGFQVPGDPMVALAAAPIFDGTEILTPTATFVGEFDPIDIARQAATDAIFDGLESLAQFGDSIDDSALMQTNIPFVNIKLADHLALGDLFREHIVNPLDDYLETVPNPTPEDLANFLRSIAGSVSGLDLELPTFRGSLAGSPDLDFTLSDGTTFSVDLDGAVSIEDVIAAINLAAGFTLAAIDPDTGNRLRFDDNTAGAGAFTVAAADDGAGTTSTAGFDLGIIGSAFSQLFGSVTDLAADTVLGELAGFDLGTDTDDDLRFTLSDGTSFDLNLTGIRTLGELLEAVREAAGGNLNIDIALDGSLSLSDNTVGAGALAVTDLDGAGLVAASLGLDGASAKTLLKGAQLAVGDFFNLTLDSLLGNLNLGRGIGIRGLGLDDLEIQVAGGGFFGVSLAGTETIQDVGDTILAAFAGEGLTGFLVTVGVGNRIQISDDQGRAFDVQDATGGTGASDLGLLGSAIDGLLEGAARSLGGFEGLSFGSLLSNIGGGIEAVGGGLADIALGLKDGSTFNISFDGVSSVQGLIDQVRSVTGGEVDVEIDLDGTFRFSDLTSGAGTFSFTGLNGSSFGVDLGILGAVNGVLESADGRLRNAVALAVDNALGLAGSALSDLGRSVFDELFGDALQDEISFDLAFAADTTIGVEINPGLDPDDVPLTFDGDFTAEVIAGFDFDFTFGVDLSALPTLADAFFLEINNAEVFANLGDSSFTVSGELGFLGFDGSAQGVEPTGAVVDPFVLNEEGLRPILEVAASLELGAGAGPDNRLTLGELVGQPFTTLFDITPSGRAGLDVLVNANVGSFDTANGIQPHLEINVDSFFPFDFDGSDNTVLDAGNDTINLPGNSLVTGTEMTYTADDGAVVGLVSGTNYFVIADDVHMLGGTDLIQLAATADDAANGIAIGLSIDADASDGSATGTEHALTLVNLLRIENNLDEVFSFSNMSAIAMFGVLETLVSFFDDFRSTTPILNTEIPFTDGTTLGDLLDIGGALGSALLDDLQTNGRLDLTPGSVDAVGVWAPIMDGEFGIIVDGNAVSVVVDFTGVTSMAEVASTLEAAVNLVLDGAAEVSVAFADGALTFTSASTGSTSTVSGITPTGSGTDLTATTLLDLASIIETAGDLAFSTVQDMFAILVENVPGLDYNSGTNELTFLIDFNHVYEAFETELGFDFSLGDLASLSTSSTVRLEAELDFSATLGVNLVLPGETFVLEGATLLQNLNGDRGVIIGDEAGAAPDGLADVQVRLGSGETFDINFDGFTTVQEVLDAFNLHPDNSGKFELVINDDAKALDFTDFTTTIVEPAALLRANGSLAGLMLGLTGEDAEGDGIIQGKPLHGESLADIVFLRNVNLHPLTPPDCRRLRRPGPARLPRHLDRRWHHRRRSRHRLRARFVRWSSGEQRRQPRASPAVASRSATSSEI